MKKCILYDNKICSDCGERLICDLDPNKRCDNCGKCIEESGDQEFLSMLVHASDSEEDDYSGGIVPLTDEDIAQLSDEEKQLLAFLDAPIDLKVPEPLSIDSDLYDKWERILAEESSNSHLPLGAVRVKRAPANYAMRLRRKK